MFSKFRPIKSHRKNKATINEKYFSVKNWLIPANHCKFCFKLRIAKYFQPRRFAASRAT